MLHQNGQRNNGFAYSPIVDAPYAMMPDDAAFDEAPPVYPPCSSDYAAAPAPKAELPGWRNQFPAYTHSMSWTDSLGITHSHTVRSDNLDEILREARITQEFVKAARARHEKSTATAPAPEPQPEPEQNEQTDSAYDEPEPSRLWCERHQTWLQRREKHGNVWYSHKTAEGWCRRAAK
jgi:hypothetical protein